jgi:hypothetical protein
MVVSFMVAARFSLGFVVVRFDRTRRPSHRSQQSPSGRFSFRTLPDHGPLKETTPAGYQEPAV